MAEVSHYTQERREVAENPVSLPKRENWYCTDLVNTEIHTCGLCNLNIVGPQKNL